LKILTSSFTTPNKLFFSQLLTLFSVIFSFFGSDYSQNLISAIGILTFGILHGANDLKILSKKNPQKDISFKSLLFIAYLGVVLLGILIFYFIPALALLSFVAVSSYHFGEQHWQQRLGFKKQSSLFYFIYGAFLFFTLFYFHQSEVNEVVFQISSFELPTHLFFWGLVVSSSSVLYIMLKTFSDLKCLFQEIFLILLFTLLFYKGSLLFGFGIYFVLWHSLPSLKSQVKFLYPGHNANPYKKYIQSAFLYWVLALIGLGGFYFFTSLPEQQFLAVFFSFLAAITFPHVVVMGWMFHSSKSHSL